MEAQQCQRRGGVAGGSGRILERLSPRGQRSGRIRRRCAVEIEEAAAALIVEAGDHARGNLPGAGEVAQIAGRLVGIQAGQHGEGVVVEHAGRPLAGAAFRVGDDMEQSACGFDRPRRADGRASAAQTACSASSPSTRAACSTAEMQSAFQLVYSVRSMNGIGRCSRAAYSFFFAAASSSAVASSVRFWLAAICSSGFAAPTARSSPGRAASRRARRCRSARRPPPVHPALNTARASSSVQVK